VPVHHIAMHGAMAAAAAAAAAVSLGDIWT